MYSITEVDGIANADVISQLNELIPEWPELQPRHFANGYWWFCHLDDDPEPVAFAGLVPDEPFDLVGVGYLKRCLVKPDHHGRGLQFRMLMAREMKAKQLGWKMLVSECHESNFWSAGNFRKAGYSQCEPEQPWAKDSVYWVKYL